MGHSLDLINIARPLVIAVDPVSFLWMTLGVAPHKIRILYPAHCLARSILAGNQVDSLRLSPPILLFNNILDIANVYCHVICSLLL